MLGVRLRVWLRIRDCWDNGSVASGSGFREEGLGFQEYSTVLEPINPKTYKPYIRLLASPRYCLPEPYFSALWA